MGAVCTAKCGHGVVTLGETGREAQVSSSGRKTSVQVEAETMAGARARDPTQTLADEVQVDKDLALVFPQATDGTLSLVDEIIDNVRSPWLLDEDKLRSRLVHVVTLLNLLGERHRCCLDVRMNCVKVCELVVDGPFHVSWLDEKAGCGYPTAYRSRAEFLQRHPSMTVQGLRILSLDGKSLGSFATCYSLYAELLPVPSSRLKAVPPTQTTFP
jgi:hypothetical protein